MFDIFIQNLFGFFGLSVTQDKHPERNMGSSISRPTSYWQEEKAKINWGGLMQ